MKANRKELFKNNFTQFQRLQFANPAPCERDDKGMLIILYGKHKTKRNYNPLLKDSGSANKASGRLSGTFKSESIPNQHIQKLNL